MSLVHDLRLAIRLLIKDRRLTVAAGAAIALGIAATTTVFTIVYGAILRDMPFTDPDRVVSLRIETTRGDERAVSYVDFEDIRTRLQVLDGVLAFDQRTMNLSEDGLSPERFQGAFVSTNTFPLLGHQPMLGRDFGETDGRPGAEPVVVLGYDTWRTRYGAAESVIGRSVRVNGTPARVIGVMAEDFEFPFSAQVWLPLAAMPRSDLENRDARSLALAGRLRDGATIAQAQQDLGRVLAELGREFPATHNELRPAVTPFRLGADGEEIRRVLFTLLGCVAFLLLIACANVANLLLARSVDRSREVSVRMAIGASRWQIIRQLLIENLLLSTVAGLVGFALAVFGIRMFTRAVTGTGEPYWLDFSIDASVFAFFAAVCIGTAILFGLVPALHTSHLNVSEMLNESGRGAAGTLRARRWAGVLVVVQLALAPILLAGASLMMRTLLQAYQEDGGVDPEGLVVMRLDLSDQRYATREARTDFYRLLDERLATTPGLRATLASNAPSGGTAVREVSFAGREDPPQAQRPRASLMTIGARYFETLGVRVVRGREFGLSESSGQVPAIVNERFAAVHFPGQDPIGQRIRLTAPVQGPSPTPTPEWVSVIGVAGNIRQRDMPDGTFDPIVYIPRQANPEGFATILARSTADVGVVAQQVREAILALDADLPVFDVRTLQEIRWLNTWPFRVFGTMFSTFALIAFFLASIGLYAVTARSVAQRTREIGVRMALGAEARAIWWVVTRRASIQLAIGLVIGMAGALAIARLLLGVLIEVSPTDPVTFVGVPLLLAGVGVIASLVPARRAMRLNPVAALRHE
jgi:predicted permease